MSALLAAVYGDVAVITVKHSDTRAHARARARA